MSPAHTLRGFKTLNFCYLSTIGAYIAETVHPKIRSNLIILPGLNLVLGTTVVWYLANVILWNTVALLCIVPPVTLFIIMVILPETPYWLIEAKNPILAE